MPPKMPPPAPAIELSRLWRGFGPQMVLRDINLVIDSGKVVVLRGGNGSGKTTLLRVLATRLRPHRGGGRVFGFELTRHAHEVRRRVALVSVLGGNYPTLTARENLRFAARLYGHGVGQGAGHGAPGVALEQQLDEKLELVGLADAANKQVRTFSSGMKKRLSLARLLLADAPLWLLDEPYAALDDQGRALIDRLLEQARRSGRTVVLASHEQVSASLIDATLELAGGKLRAAGVAAGAALQAASSGQRKGSAARD